MADIKWIKITTNMFEDEKIRLIDAMPERDTIHYVWIRLLVQAGKTNSNGFIFLGENIPYTEEMLSTIFCRPLTSIRLALKTLKDFRMIEVDEDNLIKITNWEKHQNVEGMERVREQNRIRAKNYREKKKQLKPAISGNEDGKKESVDHNNEETISLDEEDICDKSLDYNNEISDEDLNNVTNLKSNVIQNESNVKVTKENKRESKTKKKTKKKIKSKRENKKKIEKENRSEKDTKDSEIQDKNKSLDENYRNSEKNVYQSDENKNNIFSSENLKNNSNSCGSGDFNKEQISFKDKLEEANNKLELIENQKNAINNTKTVDKVSYDAEKLLKYYESMTGAIGGLNVGYIKLAISIHGFDNVKMAINKALELNKDNINYINGILKNWRKEGYPTKEKDYKSNSKGRGTNFKFNNFEPRKYDYDSLEKKLLGWEGKG